MRIAFLTTEFVTEPYFAGGLAQYLGRVAPALAARGHQVEVFVKATEEGQTTYEGVLVHRVKPMRSLVARAASELHHIATGRHLAKLHQLLAFAKGLDRALRRRYAEAPFDIVQAASWMVTGLYAVRTPIAPVVIRLSSYGPLLDAAIHSKPGWEFRTMWKLERNTMRRAAAVYAPSAYLADHVSHDAGLEVAVVRPPFWRPDDSQHDPTAAAELRKWGKYLLFFGRLSGYKGVGILAEAMAPLLAKDPTLRLVMAGPQSDDPEGKKLTDLTQAFPQQLRYLGVLPPTKLGPVVEHAQAVVLPSLLDNLPNTCLEAMHRGRVVVGPNGISFDELIENGKSGILFEAGSMQSLRTAVLRAWRLPPETRDLYGRAARERIDRLDPEHTLPKLERFFAAAAETARAGTKDMPSGTSGKGISQFNFRETEHCI